MKIIGRNSNFKKKSKTATLQNDKIRNSAEKIGFAQKGTKRADIKHVEQKL
jgi:hypothetical protein